MKAISKGSLAGCLVNFDAGSTDFLAQQTLQIPEHANNRTKHIHNIWVLGLEQGAASHPPDPH